MTAGTHGSTPMWPISNTARWSAPTWARPRRSSKRRPTSVIRYGGWSPASDGGRIQGSAVADGLDAQSAGGPCCSA